ncbi:MAG: 3-oxoacyl-ACP reductase FabG [Desulfobacteraceae bacterium]|nr:3-oxoacyl-ACP reductase FabG [Desulfobacteraceae bacterium]
MILKDKVALVTGSGQGIGKAIAEKFSAQGANVIVCDVSGNQKNVCKDIWQKGFKARPCTLDVIDYEAVQATIKKLVDELGKIDILVNNAGINMDRMFHKMSVEDWSAVLDVNINGVFNCSRAVLGGMRERGSGNIINISSTSRFGNIGQANYSTSKAALAGLTRTLAKESGARGIRVNAVAPGLIATDMYKNIPEEKKQTIIDKMPLKNPGKPEDVANLCLFLASEASSFITGQIIHCDGGLYTF